MTNKIYTRTGDTGETSLFAGGRVDKDTLRLHAYGTVDELNSTLGLALAQGLSTEIGAAVLRIQSELFSLGADLATPLGAEARWIVRLEDAQILQLEQEIDDMAGRLPPLRHFILPGGTAGAAALHIARTVCRRAERWVVATSHAEDLNPHALQYVNRLSDWLFVAARLENLLNQRDEMTWQAPTRD